MKISNFLVAYLFFRVYCEGCIDTDGDATDRDGDGCDDYSLNPHWCGGSYDDFDFTADAMCCVCGGGICEENEHVQNGTCVSCPVGTWCSSVVFERGVRENITLKSKVR